MIFYPFSNQEMVFFLAHRKWFWFDQVFQLVQKPDNEKNIFQRMFYTKMNGTSMLNWFLLLEYMQQSFFLYKLLAKWRRKNLFLGLLVIVMNLHFCTYGITSKFSFTRKQIIWAFLHVFQIRTSFSLSDKLDNIHSKHCKVQQLQTSSWDKKNVNQNNKENLPYKSV
jgi:hypothetical protein